jgi:hypothetical protein
MAKGRRIRRAKKSKYAFLIVAKKYGSTSVALDRLIDGIPRQGRCIIG